MFVNVKKTNQLFFYMMFSLKQLYMLYAHDFLVCTEYLFRKVTDMVRKYK